MRHEKNYSIPSNSQICCSLCVHSYLPEAHIFFPFSQMFSFFCESDHKSLYQTQLPLLLFSFCIIFSTSNPSQTPRSHTGISYLLLVVVFLNITYTAPSMTPHSHRPPWLILSTPALCSYVLPSQKTGPLVTRGAIIGRC